MIYVSPPLNSSVINPSYLSLVRQQSYSYSQNNPRENRCSNRKDSNSKINESTSTVIPVTHPLNDSVVNPTQLSSVSQQSSSTSHNTTHELQASSIPGRTSHNPSNTMPLPSTNNVACNIYGCMVDVSKLTPEQ